ncbi:hypothetical protein EC988_008236, partial [Linderina pennispora]
RPSDLAAQDRRHQQSGKVLENLQVQHLVRCHHLQCHCRRHGLQPAHRQGGRFPEDRRDHRI